MNKLEKIGAALLGSGLASCVGPSLSSGTMRDYPADPISHEASFSPGNDPQSPSDLTLRSKANSPKSSDAEITIDRSVPLVKQPDTFQSEIKRHTVVAGDTLWNIAERSLGAGRRSGEILELNPGLDPSAMAVGTVILLPEDAIEIEPRIKIVHTDIPQETEKELPVDALEEATLPTDLFRRTSAVELAASEACIKFLKSWEGECGGEPVLTAYKCQGGAWTIGWGTTRGVYSGMSVTVEEADRFFRQDLSRFENIVKAAIKAPVCQQEFDAMLSLCYNIGPGDPTDGKPAGFLTSTALRLLNQERYDEVPAAIKMWNKAGGKVSNGLVRRRAEEADMFAGRDFDLNQ